MQEFERERELRGEEEKILENILERKRLQSNTNAFRAA